MHESFQAPQTPVAKFKKQKVSEYNPPLLKEILATNYSYFFHQKKKKNVLIKGKQICHLFVVLFGIKLYSSFLKTCTSVTDFFAKYTRRFW